MQFRIDEFYRINRRIIIWAAIFGLVWVLRDFFALIFLTFLLVSFTLPPIGWLHRRTRLPRALCTVALYALLFAALVGFLWYAVPQVVVEASTVADQLRTLEPDLIEIRGLLGRWVPSIQPAVDLYLTDERVGLLTAQFRAWTVPMLRQSAIFAAMAVSTTLLSLLFAFLIVLDLPRLTGEVRRMERSRMREFFEEGGEPVAQFLLTLSQAFRAQAVVALVNAILTGIGFYLLGLPNIALLTIIVFLLGFIPVLGAFFSTIPAILVAENTYGPGKVIAVVVVVAIIHVFVAYILAPLVYGRHFKVNPVIVLVVLLVGYHFFGVWGMLLGVPVYTYIAYSVLGVGREGDTAKKEGVEKPA